MLDGLFRASGVALNVAVEATGWELLLRFAKYGVGIAIVNDFCPPPKGMIAIPLEGAAAVTYYLVERAGRRTVGAETMRRLVLETTR